MQHNIGGMGSEKFEKRNESSFAYFKDCFLAHYQ